MSSLQFVFKFTLTVFVFALHVGLGLLFLLSFIVRSGRSTEGIAIGIEAILIFMLSIRLWYYYTRYRTMTNAHRMQRDSVDERVFLVALWVLSLANAVWITVHALNLPEGFAGVPHPDVAAIASITLIWLAWTVSVHLLWILVQEENAWLDAVAKDDGPVRWPSTAAAGTYTPPPPRRFPSDKRISAKIVAVQHGSPPELWAKKNFGNPRAEVGVPGLQPAKPTYNPRARQFCEPPPVKTSRYQWYIIPGEAV
ncbi:hypothetical protein L226DRAFT_183047 [Lentinus tigrinus ALCF2SS1-7]|uniref:Uncharacterized protein n=1 Tax=Lentinus tigrinus ALCF2SS1-6 TaxID=1328759 RepID=A0A5C2SRE3_9APHY|nr:hypothetical protein L227DRAFT_125514 [Lentinus tigrinus ALCF2SS1-6]RPD79842.1 hypothetical protein L226DRAFT_183047 [Lentinus tigrinus ALCF2SS1-7]